jgi:chaperonin GroES
MQPLSNFIWVEVEKSHENSTFIKGKNNEKIELYLDSSFEPEFNARQHGTVYAVSKNVKGVEAGDKIYCHHFLVSESNRVKFIDDKLVYKIREPFVYAIVRNGKIKMLNNWVFVEQVKETEDDCKTESGIWFKPNPHEEELHGVLKHSNNELFEQGVKLGDRVIFSTNSEYVMKIEGEELMRMRNEDVLAIYNG